MPGRRPEVAPERKKAKKPDLLRAARIQEALAEKGWTQRELGRRIGVNEVSAWKIVQGMTVPREGTMRRLCMELGVRPEWVLFGAGEKRLRPGERLPQLGSPQPGPARLPGLSEWLEGTPEGRAASPAARAFLAGIPWPQEPLRAPDEAYFHALEVFRLLTRD